MNNYNVLAEMSREALKTATEEGLKATLESKIRIYDALAGLNDDEILRICDTGEFNQAIIGYAISGMQGAGLDDETIRNVVSVMKGQQDDISAEAAQRIYNEF